MLHREIISIYFNSMSVLLAKNMLLIDITIAMVYYK